MTEHWLLWAVSRAGISREQGRITWHDLRHTYGSHVATRGVPLKAIQELMSHATIEMTMRYAHLVTWAGRARFSNSTSACPFSSTPLRPATPEGHTEGTSGTEEKEKPSNP